MNAKILKKCLVVLLAVIFLVSVVVPIIAARAATVQDARISFSCAVYEKPDAGSKKVAQLIINARVQVIAVSNSKKWLQIKTSNGVMGFMSAAKAIVYEHPAQYKSPIDVKAAKGSKLYLEPSKKNLYKTLTDAEVLKAVGATANYYEIKLKDNTICFLPKPVAAKTPQPSVKEPSSASDIESYTKNSNFANANNNDEDKYYNSAIPDDMIERYNSLITKLNATIDYDGEKALFDKVNDYRAKKKKPALVWNDNLAFLMRLRLLVCVDEGLFTHDVSDLGSPWDTMELAFGTKGVQCYENLSGAWDVEKAFNTWLNSPDHDQNMLQSKACVSGLGVVKVPGHKYPSMCMQVFVP